MVDYDIQFVDAITATPTVRLDLNASPWALQSSTDFGMPELRRAATSTLLADGEQYPAAAYGNRLLTLVLQVHDSDDNIATAMQQLHRELDRPTNILKYRPGTSEPVFFRTFRAGPSAVVWRPELHEVTVQIPAEPFALGLMETITPSSISNDPAALANGQYADLTGIKGDVETPIRLKIPQANGLVAANNISVVAIRRRGVTNAPFLVQAESMTQGTDTNTQTHSSDASGGGNNWCRTSFLTNTGFATRLSYAGPSTASPNVRGRYRIFARIQTPTPTDPIYIRVRWGLTQLIGGTTETQVGGGFVSTNTWYVADLGLISFPSGVDPGVDGYSGLPLSAVGQLVSFEARRQSGTGSLDWDYVVFVPADDRLCIIDWGDVASAGASMVVDGTTESVYPVDSSGVVYGGGTPPSIVGGFPMISPGVTNRLYWLRTVGVLASDGPAATTSMTVTYWPRYLYVRPVGS